MLTFPVVRKLDFSLRRPPLGGV